MNTLNACITRADDQLSKPITLQTKNAECNKHRVDAIVVRAYFRLG